MSQFEPITKSILIHVHVAKVWRYLTSPDLMKTWMLDDDMELEIVSEWKVDKPFNMNGRIHDMDFENKGKIVAYHREKKFCYSMISSLSNLPDKEENYTTIEFDLNEMGSKTYLTLTITNFPEESIYRHLNFYWTVAIEGLKQKLEHDDLL